MCASMPQSEAGAADIDILSDLIEASGVPVEPEGNNGNAFGPGSSSSSGSPALPNAIAAAIVELPPPSELLPAAANSDRRGHSVEGGPDGWVKAGTGHILSNSARFMGRLTEFRGMLECTCDVHGQSNCTVIKPRGNIQDGAVLRWLQEGAMRLPLPPEATRDDRKRLAQQHLALARDFFGE